MAENKTNWVETTDCLEALGVFKGWKNFFFVILVIGLLLYQGLFWYVSTSYDQSEPAKVPLTAKIDINTVAPAEANAVKTDTNSPAAATVKPEEVLQAIETKSSPRLTEGQLNVIIRLMNYVLGIAACMYCLTMLFALKISMLGRLGGINHIARAFFLALLLFVFILPWQTLFNHVLVGLIYTPAELFNCHADYSNFAKKAFGNILFYLRFVGLWVLSVLFLVFAQFRSYRWAKNILKRLEIID
jgi:hypothetical protein